MEKQSPFWRIEKIRKQSIQNSPFNAYYNQLKQAAIILFFTAIFYSQVGYFIAGRALQLVLKEQANERLLTGAPDSTLVAIVLDGNESNIHWEEPGREFSYNGHMYDVVRVKKINTQTVCFCVDDEHEDALIEKLNRTTQSNGSSNGNTASIPGVKLVYCFTALAVVTPAPVLVDQVYPFIELNKALQHPCSSVTVPPPRNQLC